MRTIRDFGKDLNRQDPAFRERILGYANVKLAMLGLPYYERIGADQVLVARELIANVREKDRLLSDYLPPADRRIQEWLASYLGDLDGIPVPRLPAHSLVLDRYGMARELSLPPEAHKLESPTLTSYRIRQGVLHNPRNDRRTTKGVFHVAEGGLPVPPDKKSVPKAVFARLLAAALDPPDELNALPVTALQERKARTFVSLLLRPPVCPEIPGFCPERSMELRFFAPGSLVSNLDFVESIFGNAGDPSIPENDAALDPLRWTGHTGLVVLATHLVDLRKKDLGLPPWGEATERQRRDGMAWKDPEEKYNEGGAFKICARDGRGVIVTIIADNYYGYSKKEVKAQVSYSANLHGLCEEEHSGGALAFPRYNLGTRFLPDTNLKAGKAHTLKRLYGLMGDAVEPRPQGYAVDRAFPGVVYLPEDAVIVLEDQEARWTRNGKEERLRVIPGEVYVHPSGYKVILERHPESGAWRLVGCTAEGTYCHKPCTVSGGGKSEISKSIGDAMSYMPYFVGDFEADMDQVAAIIDKDYTGRFIVTPEDKIGQPSRTILSEDRSLGSVIKLLSPSPLYTPEFNTWLEAIPPRIKALVFLVKRFYRAEWKDDWRSRFTVDSVNGRPGNVIKYGGRQVFGSYLRVGSFPDGAWRVFKLRQDFMPAAKVQMEDDITASAVAPAASVRGLSSACPNPSVKICVNVENRFFQRPDDAVKRGYDRQAESDLAGPDNFISNFEPFRRERARAFVEKAVDFSEYSAPMRKVIEDAVDDPAFEYFVASSCPRLVDGAPSKNPRYLQLDSRRADPLNAYLADVGARLYRGIPAGEPVVHAVNATLPGRRNNPADRAAGIRPLAVYNPLHYQELPELFMDFVCSLTGKSPSTTGAGSEGALTKGPFNPLVATTDLDNALLSFILTGYKGWSSAAGHIGGKYKVDHDVSLLVPELWCRLSEEERDPAFLMGEGCLEKLDDFDYGGRHVLASRLGYRITRLFASTYLGRIFDAPDTVFSDDMLRPELQGIDDFADGIDNIVEAQRRAALDYFEDGSVEAAIPPLKAILHVMAHGHYEGRPVSDPQVRRLFDRDYVLGSDWYAARLERYRFRERDYLERGRQYVGAYLKSPRHAQVARELGLEETAKELASRIGELERAGFSDSLKGTIGLDPLFRG